MLARNRSLIVNVRVGFPRVPCFSSLSKVMQMCEDVNVMEGHLNAIQVIFTDLGKNFHEQDAASERIEKEVNGMSFSASWTTA